MTLLSKYKRWLDRNKSESTIRGYLHSIKYFGIWLKKRNKKLSQAGGNDVDDYIEYLTKKHGKGSPSIARHYHAIRSFFKFQKKINSLSDVIPPSVIEKEPECMDYDDLIKLIQECNNIRDKLILMALFSTGIRIGELCALTISDVDFNKKLIRIKTEKKRTGMAIEYLPLEEFVLDLFKKYFKEIKVDKSWESDLLIFNISDVRVRQIMHKLAKKAGVDKNKAHPHALRHGRATEILRSGGRLRYIQKLLRHKSITTTERYTKIVPEDLRDNIPPAFKQSSQTDSIEETIEQKQSSKSSSKSEINTHQNAKNKGKKRR